MENKIISRSEVRKGNLFMDKANGKWIALSEDEVNIGASLSNREGYPLKNGRPMVPIPITLEIMGKCDKMQLEKVAGLLMVFVDNPARLWWLGVEKTKQQIKTLHDLQNWYFSETGEELILNDEE